MLVCAFAEKCSEWARWGLALDGSADFALHARHECRCEGLPLGVHAQVVVFPLVLEEHVLVSPVRGHELSIHVDLTDQLLSAAELDRLVHGINFVKSLSGRHLLEHFLQIELSRVLDRASVRGSWLESQFPGEDRVLLLRSVLAVHRKVGEAH